MATRERTRPANSEGAEADDELLSERDTPRTDALRWVEERAEWHPPAPLRPRVLLAEDDLEMRRLVAKALRQAGYTVTEAEDGFALLEQLGSYLLRTAGHPYDVIVSDIRMPDVTGLDVLEGLGNERDFPPVVLMTAFGSAAVHAAARRLGAAALLDKPFDLAELLDTVRRLLPPDRAPSRGSDG
jgi:CheY-like chemotaxis protein